MDWHHAGLVSCGVAAKHGSVKTVKRLWSTEASKGEHFVELGIGLL
jgi:hypothetical protein